MTDEELIHALQNTDLDECSDVMDEAASRLIEYMVGLRRILVIAEHASRDEKLRSAEYRAFNRIIDKTKEILEETTHDH